MSNGRKLIVDMTLIDKPLSGSSLSIWAKKVTKIDMNQKGGFALEGSFAGDGELRQISETRFKYTLYTQTYNGKVVAVCAQVKTHAITCRVVFVLVPFQQRHKPSKHFPSVIAAVNNGGETVVKQKLLNKQGEKLADVELYCYDKLFSVAVFGSYEYRENKNTLFAAAEFIDKSLELKPDKDSVATVPHVGKGVDPVSGLVPVKKKKESKARRKDKTFNPDKQVVFQKKNKIPVPGKGLQLPADVFFLRDIDGIKLLAVGDEPRMMHILADFENVTDEIREVMREQADQLRAMAAAYDLVAGMGDSKKKVREPPNTQSDLQHKIRLVDKRTGQTVHLPPFPRLKDNSDYNNFPAVSKPPVKPSKTLKEFLEDIIEKGASD